MAGAMKIKIGDIYPSKSCGTFEVISIESYKRIFVKFSDTGYEAWAQGGQITDGRISDKLTPTVYGVGILGEIDFNLRGLKSYKIWHSMMQRCYDKSSDRSIRNKSYTDTTVCSEWHYYLNFKSWFDINYIEGYCLDKDLTILGNKEYSESACCFIPNEINCLLIHPRLSNTGIYPVGVHLDSESGKFVAQLSMQGRKRKFLGYHYTPEEAFKAYKEAKEIFIKKVALEYYQQGKINNIIYNNLINYKVIP